MSGREVYNDPEPEPGEEIYFPPPGYDADGRPLPGVLVEKVLDAPGPGPV